jgi:glycosyltransferase involved in cell wall biosynthesis
MAVGVPVISSNTGGIPEVNVHGFSGFLSDVGNVDDMAKNMLILLKEENLKQFKINAKERSKAFSLESILPKYEEIYFNLVKASNV